MSDAKRQTGIKDCLIVCNGKIYKKDLAKFLNRKNYKKPRNAINIIACDGASDYLLRDIIVPDVIIGDLDSISSKAKKFFLRKKVKLIYRPDQNLNDLEKALKYADSKKYNLINITGLTGKRFDHTLNNLSVVLKYYKKMNIVIHENGFTGSIINKSRKINCKEGNIISLIPLPKATGITTNGLKYPIKNETFEFGVRAGALNEALSSNISINFRKGVLLVLIK